jgi:hypothetical protein
MDFAILSWSQRLEGLIASTGLVGALGAHCGIAPNAIMHVSPQVHIPAKRSQVSLFRFYSAAVESQSR